MSGLWLYSDGLTGGNYSSESVRAAVYGGNRGGADSERCLGSHFTILVFIFYFQSA